MLHEYDDVINIHELPSNVFIKKTSICKICAG